LGPKRNRVLFAMDQVYRGCEYIHEKNMKGSELFKVGKKTGKETRDVAKEAFEKGKASGQKEKDKGKKAGNDVSV
jgi:hypothetical protein